MDLFFKAKKQNERKLRATDTHYTHVSDGEAEDSPFSTKCASGTGVLADGTGLPLNHLWELTSGFQAVLCSLQAVQKDRLDRSGKRAAENS